MITRRTFLQSGAAAAALASSARSARADATPGITATEIKIGQTMPYSGPASAYGVIGRTEAAYFKMINEEGGVNGRKIEFKHIDDEFDPVKGKAALSTLVEDDKIFALVGHFGTPVVGATIEDVKEYGIPYFSRDLHTIALPGNKR